MYPSANLLMVVVVVLSLALAVAIMFLGVLLTNARGLSRSTAERLVDDLAQRQHDLEVLLTKIESSEPERPDPGVATPAHLSSTAARKARPDRRLVRSEAGVGSGPTLIAVPNLAASPSKASEPASTDLYRRFGAIWTLADAGSSPEMIARSTGQPIGQVELILALRRQLAATSPGARPDA